MPKKDWKLVLLAALVSSAVAAKTDITTLSTAIWTTTDLDGSPTTVTPIVAAGVTLYTRPTSSPAATTSAWVSLDISGIPYNKVATTTTVGSVTSTINPSPTPYSTDSVFSQQDSPVLGCWSSRLPLSSTLGVPFCTPQNGSELVVGETYFITWDPTWFGGDIDDVQYIKLQGRRLPIDDDDDTVFITDNIVSRYGFWPLTVDSKYAEFTNDGYFFLDISPVLRKGTNATHAGTQHGPILRFISSVSEATSYISRLPSDNVVIGHDKSGLAKSTKIAIGVAVPVVGLLFIAIIVYMLIYRKKGRTVRGVFSTRGYAVRSSRSQRMRRSKPSNIELSNVSQS